MHKHAKTVPKLRVRVTFSKVNAYPNAPTTIIPWLTNASSATEIVPIVPPQMLVQAAPQVNI